MVAMFTAVAIYFVDKCCQAFFALHLCLPVRSSTNDLGNNDDAEADDDDV